MMKKRLYIILIILCLGLSTQAQTDPAPAATTTKLININGKVFGGARQADVGGSTTVEIKADNHDIIIDAVYGGNDISGKIEGADGTTVKTDVEGEGKHLFIGKVFGGGYGDYTYSQNSTDNTKWDVTVDGETITSVDKPDVIHSHLTLMGGTFAQAYGGGDNVTVTGSADITINNTSTVTNSIKLENVELLTATRMTSMHLNSVQTNIEGSFQFGRVFGGNNLAPMAIRPTWHLIAGSIRDLYSGGNAGDMTYYDATTGYGGILLAITGSGMTIDNVYGGCRMADVNPGKTATDPGMKSIAKETIDGVEYPQKYAARVYITAGNINNVYGGNDISGTVYGGNAVGIHSNIKGNVYGGGNGSYSYTNVAANATSLEYGDFYYSGGVADLNAFRPNAEAVSIRVVGTDADHPTIIGGAIYCGGNSATISTNRTGFKAEAQLKIGSYVYADEVFLGNNGKDMVKNDVLAKYADGTFSSLTLTTKADFETYMDGVAMKVMPNVTFDDNYVAGSTYFGSFYCGGNVGSVKIDNLIDIQFDKSVIIFNKVVGGSNAADVTAVTGVNASYQGGLLGSPSTDTATKGDKLHLTFKGLKMMPKRWKDDNDKAAGLEWNTYLGDVENDLAPDAPLGPASADDKNRRIKGGNIYGGCYESGHVNGNVVINIEESIVDLDGPYAVFDTAEGRDADGATVKNDDENILYNHPNYHITARHSGVILDEQGMDVMGSALNVFGGGYGEDSEIWGSTTINLTKGFAFQLFGGGEKGAIGKKKLKADGTPDLDSNGQYQYDYDANCSTYLNLNGAASAPGVSMKATASVNMPECIFIYGGGFEGLITGDTHINLGNGRVFNTFAGSCNADVIGHTETVIGANGGFPWVRDHVYGGNDLGGHIYGGNAMTSAIYENRHKSYRDKISASVLAKVHNPQNKTITVDGSTVPDPDVLYASTYMEYNQGRVDYIFGGCYGDYDYTTEFSTVNHPQVNKAFVNFSPNTNGSNSVLAVFGAGQGHQQDTKGSKMQYSSYVLVNVPAETSRFENTQVFGAGAYVGLGMDDSDAFRPIAKASATADKASAIIDLVSGNISAAFGGSYEEGITRRTVVNVPSGSTIKLKSVFGGAYGLENNANPCDVLEAFVNYNSEDATVSKIYGGNNNYRRTIRGTVNINSNVWSNKASGYQATVFGAGFGENTWSEYTEVNLESGATVYEVYGGGENGRVLNRKSVAAYATANNLWNQVYADVEEGTYNTNVIIKNGATVTGYAYGGGLGSAAIPTSGDVCGITNISLLGGIVNKDIYASGSTGSVYDYYGVGDGFVAKTYAMIEGGMVRNVYGGGWRGGVGKHTGDISVYANNATDDIDGESHVVIGKLGSGTFTNGVPAIKRNVYGGGEGGSVFGTAYVTINNGRIGYYYNESTGKYVDQNDDAEDGDNLLKERGGCVFGGAYVANSFVDRTVVTMYDGMVRGSLYGGGEIGAIGRGYMKSDAPTAPFTNDKAKIYKGGETHIYLYGGYVLKDVFGGGRGYDNWQLDGRKFMSAAEIASADFNAKGYVFGSTDVHIRGGEVGTEAGAFQNHGNIFGGGNEGFVYSATGKKVGSDRSDEHLTNGLPTDGGGFYYMNGVIANGLSHDCNVVVEPYCKVVAEDGVSFTANTELGIKASYAKGEYVPVEALNQLKKTSTQWASLDDTGITIYNAVFAGGNIMEGSDIVNANTPTVFGNAAASLRDAYNRDFITVGTNDMGGLYGDGNLTLVDGFREVHIDNYGTDYYYLENSVTLAEYNNMNPREQDYYQLKFVTNVEHLYAFWESKNLHNYGGITYKKGQKITQSVYETFTETEQNNWTYGTKSFAKGDEIDEAEYILMDTVEQGKWVQSGVFSIYAGRLLNTIQRADMCGVFGSRMVLKGAEDRVPQVVDYSSYTINRVDEVSLNKRISPAGDDDEVNKEHGNYFGIYNSVNYLGNLTSDVFFDDKRLANTDNTDLKADGETTYYGWKIARAQNKYRNNGTCHNKVALASGVFLEIKREEGEATGTDDWGYITGVVELDLINVMPGMGGGYVYAKNVHGSKIYHSGYGKVTLLKENESARTYRRFTYNESSKQEIETSGNFIHFNKQIVDDCYPNGGVYNDGYVQSPAHYWFIKGSIYVYDQYISAYTGAANAYAERIEMPLTITAASHGKMTLREVQPNYYAYYDKNGNKLGDEDRHADETFMVNNKPYYLNDPISYWDYRLLSDVDKTRFVEETYTTIAECTVTTSTGTTTYAKGYTLLPEEYTSLKNSSLTKKLNEQDTEAVHYVHHVEENKDVAFDFVFRPSNNMGHNTGYVLTYDVNNPMVWNNYYTLTSTPGQANSKNTDDYAGLPQSDKLLYTEGPTYTPKSGKSNVYGQRQLKTGEIINANTYQAYMTNVSGRSGLTDQATVEQAYIVKSECTVTDKSGYTQQLYKGAPVAKGNYTVAQWEDMASYVEPAKECVSLLQFTVNDYVYPGKLLTSADIAELMAKVKAMNSGWTDDQAAAFLNDYLSDAYICTNSGLYGGSYFEAGKAYRALDTWCNMTKDERENFIYNYDAFDVLVDDTYSDRLESNYGEKQQYDGNLPTKVYSVPQSIDYKAEYKGSSSVTYTKKDGTTTVTIDPSTSSADWLTRSQYEDIPNEKHHYSPITITSPGSYYVVKEAFMRGDIPYTTGQVIEASSYNSMTSQQKEHVEVITFTDDHTKKDDDGKYLSVNYFYCRESYVVNEKGEGQSVTTMGIKSGSSVKTYISGEEVPVGVIINQTNYDKLKNYQQNFLIHGTAPTEVSTLYVSSESDIFNLSKEKIITVIYLYEYEESDESGKNVVPVSERHVVNIHINFKSGIPQIGELNKPSVVLPGTTIGMDLPSVTQGAYRVTGSGWELFSSRDDADTGTNGQPYINNSTPVYWYQDQYWIAYYAETYLGKTYSTPVQITVANSHDLSDVLTDKENHMFIDHRSVKRAPKIYIDQTKHSGENQLGLLKDLYTLSIGGTGITGHTLLNTSQVGGLKNLEFFLCSDLTAPDDWASIGNSSYCFDGTIHGDGHTISGLKNSLFNDLCGEVYNLGVTGSFTGAGVAETGKGYLENCWVSTTGTLLTGYAVFGNPSRTDTSKPIQVVNCYYPQSNAYGVPSSTTHGKAIPMEDKAFYNGEVAYDLNEFYLFKRYCDNNSLSSNSYSYWKQNTGGSSSYEKQTGYYESKNGPFMTGSEGSYVENRYADGDFIYANKTLPTVDDIRLYKDKDDDDNQHYYPIWPDDYLFFGQKLNYGHITGESHQDVPSVINKDEHGLLLTDESGNRVYRGTGYFGSSKTEDTKAVHFNPYAVFAKTKKGDTSVKAFEGMTAIDLMTTSTTHVYRNGEDRAAPFYSPLLDDDGLTNFTNVDLTRNLLVYTGTNTTTSATAERDLKEPVYQETNEDYRTVAPANTQNISVQGHWVNNGTAKVDHFLVDDNDFNAPIQYTFDSGKRMWYQRTPDRYVTAAGGTSEGWEDISLPFEVELVTTQTKGELTHFYQDSTTGHEYWLRELTNIKNDNPDDLGIFQYPQPANNTKVYSNTFLYDHYYSYNEFDDKNRDDYQKQYYASEHTFSNYPLQQAGKPYLIGFPGAYYYEFDLSGEWEPSNSYGTPANPRKQTITFASKPGITIAVSDTELKKEAYNGYLYCANYKTTSVPSTGYLLNSEGSKYTSLTEETEVRPFRPYFVKSPTSGARGEFDSGANNILINEELSRMGVLDHQDLSLDENLIITPGKKKICVESQLHYTTDVRIVTVAGMTLSLFSIEPGETVETRVETSGVYIVYADGGKYVKKVIVK